MILWRAVDVAWRHDVVLESELGTGALYDASGKNSIAKRTEQAWIIFTTRSSRGKQMCSEIYSHQGWESPR